MTEELWVDIPGFTNRYEVSDCGRVRSFAKPGPPIILKPAISYSKTGRIEALRVTLVQPRRSHAVHHLVLEGFVGPRPPGTEGAHGDGDPANNLVGNLRWATHQENIDDRGAHGTGAEGARQGLAKLTDDIVREVRSSSERTAVLARQFGVTWRALHLARIRETWKHVI